MNDNSLNLHDFLNASGDSAKRTRFLMIVLIVIFVLALAGYLNSIGSGWMVSRIQAVSDLGNPYTARKLGYDPEPLDARYINFHSALTRSYVENALTMRVPFFGVAFDINDLGLLSGISFIAVLGLLRFSVRNEIVNLSLSFEAARQANDKNAGELEKFYNLLAMKLVFTIPQLRDNERSQNFWIFKKLQVLRVLPNKQFWIFSKLEIFRFIPKLVCFLPFVIYSMVAVNDYITLATGKILNPQRTTYLFFYTGFFWILIPVLGMWCFRKLRAIDAILDVNWELIKVLNSISLEGLDSNSEPVEEIQSKDGTVALPQDS